jgi:hypothetical protein
MGRTGRPLLPDRPRWESEVPMTREALERQRAAFWDTAPSYEGDLQVWEALRLVCDPNTDLATAQVILDSAGIILQTGRLADGAYDMRGCHYSIPNYCLSDPINLLEETVETGTTIQLPVQDALSMTNTSKSDVSTHTETCHGRPLQVTVRLTTNVDVKLEMHTQDRLYPHVTHALLKAHPPKVDNASKQQSVRVRFVRLGRMLKGDQVIGELVQSGEDHLLLQAIVTVDGEV